MRGSLEAGGAGIVLVVDDWILMLSVIVCISGPDWMCLGRELNSHLFS